MEQESDASLIALTTHFAQVQFRLKQIISADSQHKEELLKELEDFAFQGCSKPLVYDTAAAGEDGSMEHQKKHRLELMEKLKSQLEELEQCAQEAAEQEHSDEEGEGQSDSIAEKQRIIIEELRKRFDLQFGDLEQLSTEEVKQNVNKAVHEIVDPIRSKEQYVSQLQSQIQDLERYITFLQVDHPRAQARSPSPSHCHPSHSPHHSPTRQRAKRKRVSFAPDSKPPQDLLPSPSSISRSRLVGPIYGANHPVPRYRLALTQLDGVHCSVDNTMVEWEKIDSYSDPLSNRGTDDVKLSLLVMRKTLAVMQILTLCQCGGTFQCLPRYVADGRRRRYHSALHSLELAVDKIAIITTALNEPGITPDSCVSLEIDLHETVSMSLADSLRILIEHGLLSDGKPILLTGGCFPLWRTWGKERMGRGSKDDDDCPAWRVFKYYYHLKNGQEFSCKPEQLLSSSFDLPVDSTASIKKTLLSSVHKIDHMFSKCDQRSSDTKFRALICEGFNVNHLPEWFRIISTHPSVAEHLYSVNSFLATTGFRPALVCLERLRDNPPCQPVQLPHAYYQHTDAFLATSDN